MNEPLSMLEAPSEKLRTLMSDPTEIKIYSMWKDTEGKDTHPMLSEETMYDSQRAEWRKPAFRELQASLESAQKIDPDFHIAHCNWEDVIQAAEHAYSEKARNSSLKRWARKQRPAIQMLETMASVIPEEKGLSLLRGGLVFVFQAWGQRIKNQEQVLHLFGDIIDFFTSVCENARLFPLDHTLRNTIVDFSNTIAGALGDLIKILLREHTGNWFQKKLKSLPQVESDEIEQMVDGISTAKEKIIYRLEYLRTEALANQKRSLDSIKRDTQELRRHTSDKFETVRNDMRIHTQEVIMAGLSNRVSEQQIRDAVKEELAGLKVDIPSLVQSALYQIFMDQVLSKDFNNSVKPRGTITERRSQREESIPISHRKLLEILDADPLSAIGEIQDTLRKSNTIKPQAMGRARSLLSEPKFQTWLTRAHPNVLLVDGYCKADGVGRTSPLSVLCASTLSILAQNPSHIIATFFCSQHSDQSEDPNDGPNAMIRSLIAQLISSPHGTISDIGLLTNRLVEDLETHDLEALCFFFNMVVDCIDPSKTIYCLIDNISDFEIPWNEWDNEIVRVLNNLLDAADSRKQRARMKFLLTSSTHVNELASLVDQDGDEYISMRAGKISNRSISYQGFQYDLELQTTPRRSI